MNGRRTGMNKSVRAFTLLELVITLGILFIIAVALVTFFISSNSSFVYQKGFVDTASEAQSVMAAITSFALPANQILASKTILAVGYTTGTSTIILQLPAVAADGSIIATTYDDVIFYQSGTSLYRIISADPASSRVSGTKQLSSKVNSFTITYDAVDVTQAKSIIVDIQTTSQSRNATSTGHLSQKIYLRNTP